MKKIVLIFSLLPFITSCKKYEKWDVPNFERAIVGSWSGTITTPWVEPYELEMEFFKDGHYTSKATNSIYPGLYYGTDDNSNLKLYSINSLDTNSNAAIGTITVAFDVGTTVTNILKDINFSNRGKSLQFNFYHLSYGPLEVDLKKD